MEGAAIGAPIQETWAETLGSTVWCVYSAKCCVIGALGHLADCLVIGAYMNMHSAESNH